MRQDGTSGTGFQVVESVSKWVAKQLSVGFYVLYNKISGIKFEQKVNKIISCEFRNRKKTHENFGSA